MSLPGADQIRFERGATEAVVEGSRVDLLATTGAADDPGAALVVVAAVVGRCGSGL